MNKRFMRLGSKAMQEGVFVRKRHIRADQEVCRESATPINARFVRVIHCNVDIQIYTRKPWAPLELYFGVFTVARFGFTRGRLMRLNRFMCLNRFMAGSCHQFLRALARE